MFKAIRVSAICVIAILAGGCASTAVNNKLNAMRASDVAYGKVTNIRSADNSAFRSYCDTKKDDSYWAAACKNPDAYDAPTVTVFHSGRVFTASFPVDKQVKVEKGNILKFSPAQNYHFISVAAREETPTCRWVGIDPNSGGSIVGGFVAGMLIVPAVVALSDDKVLESGVVCDGWSYKSILDRVATGSSK